MSPSTAADAVRPTTVRLTVPAEPENVAVARQVLAGIAEGSGIDDELLADINIAVTEACNNVVFYAYPGSRGPIEVTITLLAEQLVICVRDEGAGMNPFSADPDGSAGMGFGFAMMASLADQFGIDTGASGTKVRMRFDLRDDPAPDAQDLFERARLIDTGPPLEGDIDLVLTAGAPAAAVLGRFVALLGARARLSIDRISDLRLVSDALALHAPRCALDGSFHVSAVGDESGFELRVGPLQAGGSEAMIAETTLAGVGSLLHVLSDSVESEPMSGPPPGAEVLRLRLTRAS